MCSFTTAGIYDFESSTLFKEAGLYGTNDYTKYEVVVTGPPTPTATTQQATEVTETEATLNGSVNPEGQATSYYFEYGTTESYGTKTGEVSAGSGGTSQEFHFTWTGLVPNTTYYFQLVAIYGAGKTRVEGGKKTFKTAVSPGAPTATTQQATQVTETEATLKGTVPGPISPEPEFAPLGPALVQSSLKLTAPSRGSSVRGALEISNSGVGGRLEIDLVANNASLAKARHRKSTSTVVGRLVRASVSAGKVSFSISLNARAKSALRRHHKLALIVKVTLTPTRATPVTITQSVVLRS